MKFFIAITLSFLCWIHLVIGQMNEGYFEIPKLQEIIRLYIDGNYDRLEIFFKNEGYQKSYVFPKPKQLLADESFTYTNNALCDKTDIRIEVNRKNDTSPNDDEYWISYIFYSSFIHKQDEEQMKEFLTKYAYNSSVSPGIGSSDTTWYVDTKTPESIKKKGDLYLWKASFDNWSNNWSNSSSNFCGFKYRIKYDFYFRRGYASSDTVGFVSTKEGTNLRMHDGPSLSSNIIVRIPDGSKVFIIEYADKIDLVNGQSGNWCKIKFDGQTGWVWGYFIKNEKKKDPQVVSCEL